MESLLTNFHAITTASSNGGGGAGKRGRAPKLTDIQQQLVAPGDHTAKQVRHFGYLALSFVASNLASPAFNRAVVKMEVDAEEAAADADAEMDEDGSVTAATTASSRALADAVALAQKSILGVMESSLTSILFVTSLRSGLEQADASQRFWKVIERKLYEINDRTNGLLKVEKFAEVVRSLLSRADEVTLQQKAVLLLTDRIKGDVGPSPDTIALYLGLASELVELCSDGVSRDTELAQSAMFALTVLVVRFGRDFSTYVPPSLYFVAILSRSGGARPFDVEAAPRYVVSISGPLSSPFSGALLSFLSGMQPHTLLLSRTLIFSDGRMGTPSSPSWCLEYWTSRPTALRSSCRMRRC